MYEDPQEEIRINPLPGASLSSSAPPTNSKDQDVPHHNFFHHTLQPLLHLCLTRRTLQPSIIPLSHELVDPVTVILDDVLVSVLHIEGEEFGHAFGNCRIGEDEVEEVESWAGGGTGGGHVAVGVGDGEELGGEFAERRVSSIDR